MSQFSSACLIAGLAIAGGASAQTPPNADPHAWLEDVQGEKALAWVRARNAKAEAEIASTPAFKTLEAQIRAILDSEAKIFRWERGARIRPLRFRSPRSRCLPTPYRPVSPSAP